MTSNHLENISLKTFAMIFTFALATVSHAQAQSTQAHFPNMAPVDQYMTERNAEIALARTAAPDSISKEAEVMVLTRQGYEVAVKGTNGFACLVLRSWTAGANDPDFWSPNTRSPICLNEPAVRSYLPFVVKKSELILAGKTKAQMVEAVKAALDKKELPSMEPGAMSYMMSKEAYLSESDPHWHPHVMFFVPRTAAAAWGANLSSSPVLAADDPEDGLTIFLIPVATWSDGTPDSRAGH
jgi:hypothetical protein